MRDSVLRARDFIVHRLLHLDDTPRRIALGVALGFFVAWTPTIGLQMVLYLLLATLLRANKVAGLGPVWVTNPLTAIPIYYGNWWVGQFLLRDADAASERSAAEVRAALRALEVAATDLSSLGEGQFWKDVGAALGGLGYELWFGSIVVATVIGVVSYVATLRGVIVYRRRRAEQGRPVEVHVARD